MTRRRATYVHRHTRPSALNVAAFITGLTTAACGLALLLMTGAAA